MTQRNHALVIGGSLAGLLAARILGEHFQKVTIVERDSYPEGPTARKGAPQARHAHVLLGRGQQILEQLFPGFVEEMTRAGVPSIDAADDLAWLSGAGWGLRYASGLEFLSASRDLLEWVVRRRVQALPRVHFMEGVDVQRLLADPTRTSVVGVSLRHRHEDQEGTAEVPLSADLVVDASGRGSRAPQWLTELGYAAPEETIVNAFLGYASRVYQAPAHKIADWKALYLQCQPPTGTRSGLILPIEGNRWMVTLAGRSRDYPPTDEGGFMEFARSLPSSAVHEALGEAEPLTSISSYRNTENRLRHYERLACQPEGFVILGDACCTFNPVYGQGMTTAALGAVTLDECLRHGRHMGLARRFQRQLARATSVAWTMSTGEDYRYPATRGGSRTWLTRFKHWYSDQVVRLCTHNQHAHKAFVQVMHLLKAPTILFHPRVLWPVLKRTLGLNPGKPTRQSSNPSHPPAYSRAAVLNSESSA